MPPSSSEDEDESGEEKEEKEEEEIMPNGYEASDSKPKVRVPAVRLHVETQTDAVVCCALCVPGLLRLCDGSSCNQ